MPRLRTDTIRFLTLDELGRLRTRCSRQGDTGLLPRGRAKLEVRP